MPETHGRLPVILDCRIGSRPGLSGCLVDTLTRYFRSSPCSCGRWRLTLGVTVVR